MKNKIILFTISIFSIYIITQLIKRVNWNSKHEIGEVLDEFNGIKVYYNGGVGNTEGRNITKDGYNIGMKYQCVEFIKRYYYEHLNHKMPDAYGNAKDFFDKEIQEGEKNTKRNLFQFSNHSKIKPRVDDIIIFDKSIFNPFGHVAIISKINTNNVEIIQQNPGPFANSRENIPLKYENNLWVLENSRILGRLSLTESTTKK